MPVDWSKYPADWKEIALAVKNEADWQCEMCGKQCRKPGEEFDTHKRTATVAHCNHKEMDCRPENLVCACAPCHLRYDAPMKAARRRGCLNRDGADVYSKLYPDDSVIIGDAHEYLEDN